MFNFDEKIWYFDYQSALLQGQTLRDIRDKPLFRGNS